MIKASELLMGRDSEYPLTTELNQNLTKLLTAINFLQAHYWPYPMMVSSGYRPGKYNMMAHGTKNSAHLTCEAVDIVDVDGKLKEFLSSSINILAQCGLYMEDPSRTPTWCHLQIRPTTNRIFKP